MTLILSQACYGFVLQVSDRLITLQGGKPFDPISNKTILYFAPDAVVSMGYTGVAYLDGIPTDQWLAELISGHRMPPGPSPTDPCWVRLGKLPQWLHIGPTLRLIAERLTSAFASSCMSNRARKPMFELLVAGWQWSRRKRARPIVAGIRKEGGATRIKLWRSPRYIYRKFLLADTPDNQVNASERDSMLDDLRTIRSVDDAENVLVNTIRTVSRRTSYVGPDCMSVLIPPPGVGKVRVRFIPHKPRYFALVSGSPQSVVETFPTTFSPWVIGPRLVQAPAFSMGGLTIPVGRFEIAIEGPKVETDAAETKGVRLVDAGGGLQRPPEPRGSR